LAACALRAQALCVLSDVAQFEGDLEMFEFVTSAIENFVAKHKARKARKVVARYFDVVEHQAVRALPLGLAFYRSCAITVIDKTEQNPEPLLQFIEATKAMAKHYGPALKLEFNALMAMMEEVNTDPKLQRHVEAFAEALGDLVEDGNDC
jgi:hypothetical protein